MSSDFEYVPPRIWEWKPGNGGRFANINRPTSGVTHEAPLPVGEHPLQLYSRATPNGVKATIMLEELLESGYPGAEYDAWFINTLAGDQFGSGFVSVNPNSKILALVDRSGINPRNIFESGSILLNLAEKFQAFLPRDLDGRTEAISWVFWQVGSAPFVGGGFGHFYAYAPFKIEYAIDRFTMETKRQMHLLDSHLTNRQFMCGDTYSIADITIWPWFAAVMRGHIYNAVEFLDVQHYVNLMRWIDEIGARPAVKRGWMVNRTDGPPGLQMRERHSARDFGRVL